MRYPNLMSAALVASLFIAAPVGANAQMSCPDIFGNVIAQNPPRAFKTEVEDPHVRRTAQGQKLSSEHLKQLVAIRDGLKADIAKNKSIKKQLVWLITFGRVNRAWKAEMRLLADALAKAEIVVRESTVTAKSIDAQFLEMFKEVVSDLGLKQFHNSLLVREGATATVAREKIKFDSSTGEFTVPISMVVGAKTHSYEMRVGFKDTPNGMNAYSYIFATAREVLRSPHLFEFFRRGSVITKNGTRLVRVAAATRLAKQFELLGIKLDPVTEQRLRMQILNSANRAKEIRTLTALAEQRRRQDQWDHDNQLLMNSLVYYWAYGPQASFYTMPHSMWFTLYMTSHDHSIHQKLHDLTDSFKNNQITDQQFDQQLHQQMGTDYPTASNVNTFVTGSPELQNVIGIERAMEAKGDDFLVSSVISSSHEPIADAHWKTEYDNFTQSIDSLDLRLSPESTIDNLSSVNDSWTSTAEPTWSNDSSPTDYSSSDSSSMSFGD